MTPQTPSRLDARAARLTIWAARLTLGICALHVALFAVLTWSDWGALTSGALWFTEPATTGDYRRAMTFWILPGSYVVPLALLSVLLIRLTRHGVAIPGYVGAVLLGWAVAGSVLLFPGGFPLAIAPAVMLLVAYRRQAAYREQRPVPPAPVSA